MRNVVLSHKSLEKPDLKHFFEVVSTLMLSKSDGAHLEFFAPLAATGKTKTVFLMRLITVHTAVYNGILPIKLKCSLKVEVPSLKCKSRIRLLLGDGNTIVILAFVSSCSLVT